jgi:hypothetical protein
MVSDLVRWGMDFSVSTGAWNMSVNGNGNGSTGILTPILVVGDDGDRDISSMNMRMGTSRNTRTGQRQQCDSDGRGSVM